MGRSHALRLAEEGADLILVDVCGPVDGIGYPMSGKEDLAETARGVEALDRRVVALEADVRDGEQLRAVVAEGVAELGGLDAAVANAGVITVGTWDTVAPAAWGAVPAGHRVGAGHTGAYTASKFGVVGLSLSLANELAAQSIRVNTVHPTGVPTGLEAPGLFELLGGSHAGLAAIYQNALPVEMIEPLDVSNAVLYLVSDEARYVTGLQMKVDAGVGIR